MKTLIYTTAFGDENFFTLAGTMLRSLRRRGYAGEAAVLSDRPHAFAPELEARVLVAPDWQGASLLKARLHTLMDVSAYDHILFVDTDVVFLREPSAIWSLSGERMVLSRDHSPLSRNAFNLTFLSQEERRSPDIAVTRSINTGVMAFPGARYAEYADAWLEAWDSADVRKKLASLPPKQRELRDQPVMQRLITCGGLDCGYIPDNLLLMPLFFTENLPLHPDTVLLHLNGSSRSEQKKHEIAQIAAEFTALDSHDAFKRVCDRLQAGRRRASFPSLP